MSVPPHRYGRRAVLGSLALAAAGTPLALAQPWASANPAPAAGGPLWHPDVHKDGLRAFQGIEADRAHRHPERTGRYVVVEQDHWRFNIWKDDRDSMRDRQRTEVHGMQAGSRAVNMRNGETWRIAYEMFMPASMHAYTYWFNHIFQTKTPKTNDGPWVTLSLVRHGGTEMIQLQADSTNGVPVIAMHELAPLRDSWIGVEITLRIGERGGAGLVLRSVARPGAPSRILTTGTKDNIRIPDQNGYVWPKWGIYRSVRAAPSDLLDTYLLLRNFSADRLTAR